MILLARHGETADNRERRFQGQGPVPLNALGREQAAALAATVVAHDPPIAALYASPIPRARETAGIVAAAIGLEPIFDARLAETDTGDWTGRLMADVERDDPEGWAAYRRAGVGWHFPGGESLVEQTARVQAALADVRQAANGAQAGPSLVVCHRGVIRVVLCAADGDGGLDRFHDITVLNGSLVAAPVTADRITARIAAVVFGVLLIATLGAFFVAQELKSAPSVILDRKVTPVFSPNGDGFKDHATIIFGLKENDTIDVEIINGEGDLVRTLLAGAYKRRYKQIKTTWNGRNADDAIVADGRYRVRVTLRDRGRTIVLSEDTIVLDTIAPRPRVKRPAGRPDGPQILPQRDGKPATVRVRASGAYRKVLLFRMTGRGAPKRVLIHRLKEARAWSWDGTLGGRPAPAGTYVIVAMSRDKAGNTGSSVPLDRSGRPRAGYGQTFPGQGGVTVRYLGVQPESAPVTAGTRSALFVDARGEKYTWTLRRVGLKPIRRGGSASPQLRIRAPRGDSALDLVEVRSGGRTTTTPMAVQSKKTHPVLVVLPFVTWQGRNPVDDDGDGRPNTLDAGLSVRLGRIFAGDGLPAGFPAQEAPLVAALDRLGLRYDITTDAALEAGTGPTLAGHSGILLAGSVRWLPNRFARRLERFTRAGGNVASFGTGALRRYVTVTADGTAQHPTQPTDTDLFGARPEAAVAAPTTLTSQEDQIELFAGTAGQFGPFTGVEPYEDPAVSREGGTVLASAVDLTGRPVILATRVGKGVAVRFPVPGLAARLASEPPLEQLLRNTWTLLSR